MYVCPCVCVCAHVCVRQSGWLAVLIKSLSFIIIIMSGTELSLSLPLHCRSAFSTLSLPSPCLSLSFCPALCRDLVCLPPYLLPFRSLSRSLLQEGTTKHNGEKTSSKLTVTNWKLWHHTPSLAENACVCVCVCE